MSAGLDFVLMDYFNDTGKDYSNLPAKVVFTVADPSAAIQASQQEGLTILQTPSGGSEVLPKTPAVWGLSLPKPQRRRIKIAF